MGETKEETNRSVVCEFLKKHSLHNLSPGETVKKLLEELEVAYRRECSMKEKSEKWKIPDSLPTSVVADIILALYSVCRISCAGTSADAKYDLLAIYQDDGVDKGIYIEAVDIISQVVQLYRRESTERDCKEILHMLRARVPRKIRCFDKDLIAVNNGIFNFAKKELEEFTPERVFLTKSYVDYNEHATNTILHNDEDGTDWDVESWMESLSNDPAVIQLIWEILGAIIRPHVKWDKSAWFYSETGNNGKGTLCELMRNLCGDRAYACIPIADFGEQFLLEHLTHASAIIVDENDVGMFIDKASKLKAVITGDVIQINAKFKAPIAFKFHGFMVQCLNELPRIKDKSDSFYRRQLFVPMTKCFTGVERRYIKSDYLHDSKVLEYVLFKVLNMNYYELSNPEACQIVLQEYKEFNDPIRQFWNEMSEEFVWDLLPNDFLYDLYKSWLKKNSPSGSPQGKNTFLKDLRNIVANDDTWYCEDKKKKVRPTNKMDKPEPLIYQYDLMDWKNPDFKGPDIRKICRPKLKPNYCGLQRYSASVPVLVEITTMLES